MKNHEIEIEPDDWTEAELSDERCWLETHPLKLRYLSGKNHPMWGVKGKDHPAWKGKDCTTPEQTRLRQVDEVKQWRHAVWARDNYTCRFCNKEKGGELVAHHIYPWAEFPLMRICVSNGVTLCQDCHIWTHKHIGWHPTYKRKAWLNGFPNGV